MGKAVVFGLLFIVLGALGTYGYLYYQAVSGLEIDIGEVSITKAEVSGLISPTVDLDIVLKGNITSPNGIKVSIDKATFFAKLEGEDLGPGVVEAFTADSDGEPITINFYGQDLGAAVAAQVADLLLGNNKTLLITITSVTVYGITIDLNIDIEQELSSSDLI